MDHETALRSHAAERYTTGQMPSAEMDAFEEHFFACGECAEAVQDCQMLLANGRTLVQRQQSVARMPAKVSRFRYAAIAASAVFACGFGYQYLVVYPKWQKELAEAKSPKYVQSVSLRGPARSETSRPVAAGSRTLVLSFYPDQPVEEVFFEVSTPQGQKTVTGTLGKPAVSPTGECQIAVLLDSTVAAGEYDARVFALRNGDRTLLGERRISVR